MRRGEKTRRDEKRRDSPIRTGLNSFRERRVDVLDEDEASIWNEGEDLLETVVGETSFGEVEEADVVGEETGESLDVGRFP